MCIKLFSLFCKKIVDIKNMKINDFVSLSLKVITDYRVIITTVAMILVMLFIKYIVEYKRKPSKLKNKKKSQNQSQTPKVPSENNEQEQNKNALPHSDLSEKDFS